MTSKFGPGWKRPVFIFDVDGTLLDNEHRIHLAKLSPPDWDAYLAKASDDTVIESVARVARALSLSSDIWVWTARSESAREVTARKLCDVLGYVHDLRMRPVGDHRPDFIVKREWLLSLDEHDRSRVTGAFEDRKRVAQMYREHGVRCFHVDDGDF